MKLDHSNSLSGGFMSREGSSSLAHIRSWCVKDSSTPRIQPGIERKDIMMYINRKFSSLVKTDRK